MTYTATIVLPLEEYNRINMLLSLELGEMTDLEIQNAKAKTNDSIGVFGVKFEDGSEFTYDLYSGSVNYYDAQTFTDVNGEVVTFDCSYELSDHIEFCYGGNHYKIDIALEY